MNSLKRLLLGSCLCLLWGCAEPPQTDPNVTVTPIDYSRDGTYTSGPWTYTVSISHPGTRSQGISGQLLFNNLSIPIPADVNDYYETPWGSLVFVDMPPGPVDSPMMPWHDKGWMQILATEQRGKALPLPGTPESMTEQTKGHMKEILATLSRDMDAFYLETESAQGNRGLDDPWATPYRIQPDLRSAEGGGEVLRLVITSAGPDKRFDTDDIECHSAFVRVSDPPQDSGDIDLLGELDSI
jgi:hypothetical protein